MPHIIERPSLCSLLIIHSSALTFSLLHQICVRLSSTNGRILAAFQEWNRFLQPNCARKSVAWKHMEISTSCLQDMVEKLCCRSLNLLHYWIFVVFLHLPPQTGCLYSWRYAFYVLCLYFLLLFHLLFSYEWCL